MNGPSLHILLLLSFPLLVGLGLAGLLIADGQRLQKQVGARLAAVMPAAPRSRTVAAIARPREDPHSPLRRALTLFGCDFPRRNLYPVRWWVVLLATCAAGRVAVFLADGMLGTAALALWPVVWIVSSRMLFGSWDAKRRSRMLEQFPDALSTIVRTVRVGVPLAEGIRLVGRELAEPTGSQFRMVAEELSIGTRLEEALGAMAVRAGMPEYRFFATTVTLQAQTGGGLGEALETLADVVRKRVALKARGYALSSEARTSALVLTALPFVAGGAMLVVAPDYMTILFTHPLGKKMLGVAVLSLLIGTAVMRTMIRKTLS